MEGCTDGTFQMTGHKFFDCQYGRGLYFPLASLKPDERFTDPGTVPGAAAVPNRKCSLFNLNFWLHITVLVVNRLVLPFSSSGLCCT